jgi:hypothetical protein
MPAATMDQANKFESGIVANATGTGSHEGAISVLGAACHCVRRISLDRTGERRWRPAGIPP